MDRISPVAAPRLPATLEPEPPGPLIDHERWEELELTGADLAGVEARSAEILRSRLVEANLGGAQLRNLVLTDCELRGGSLANLAAITASVTRCAFSGARMTGLSLPEAVIDDARFGDCLIDLAGFAFSKLRRTIFTDCILRDADFRDVRFSSVRFHRCDLSGAQFSGARWERSELRGCTLEGIQGIEGLRGVAMDWSDVVGLAGTFAAALGIEVVEE
jgi:uncharacterized protein YjbI with pentapeptide repeats